MRPTLTAVFGALLRAAVAVAALGLTGCHADVTYRLDFHPDQTVTTTLREVVDDQMYSLATSQGGADPFGVASAQSNGWTAARSTDENENHVVVLSKTMSVSDLTSGGGPALPGKMGSSLPITAPVTEQGLFTDRTTINATIPALGAASTADSGNPYAATGSALAASIISFHIVLKAPGTVSSTNGETLPDGATSWRLSFTSPTTVQYVLDTPDYVHIGIAIVLVVVIVGGGIWQVRKRAVPQIAA